MKAPELPTDNLYKFMAVFGLLLFFSSYYFYWIRYTQIQPVVFNIEDEISITTLDRKYLSEDLESLTKDVDSLKQELEVLDKLPAKIISPQETNEYKDKLHTINDKAHQLDNLKREHEKKFVLLDNKISRLKQLNYENKIVSFAFVFSSSFGFYLSTQGFRLWYQRLQKPLDKKLAKI